MAAQTRHHAASALTPVRPSAPMRGHIRPARPAEAGALSDLAFRSKASWGYDAAFMEACRADLTLTAADMTRALVYMLDEGGQLRGFYALRSDGDEATLTDLFVEPAVMGQSYGRRLWQHAVAIATNRGCAALVLQSEPHAEGFYRAMGAECVGPAPSTVFADRLLPLMRLALR